MVVGWKAGLEKQALLLNQKAPVFVVNLSAFRELAAQLPVWGEHNLSRTSFILEMA